MIAAPAHVQERSKFLDGFRGAMALSVVIFHTDVAFGHTMLNPVGIGAVYGFFMLSGYVLARSYNGPPHRFMLKRLLRLWPLYAATLVMAYAVEARLPPLNEFAWVHRFPIAVYENSSVWSLYLEAWATPVLPLLVWIARRNRACILALVCLAFPLGLQQDQLFPLMFLLLGIAASQFAIRLPASAPAAAVWLGKISYSLYLTHAIVMRVAFVAGGKWAVLASFPVVIAAAWVTWRVIEAPCNAWSHAVLRNRRQPGSEASGAPSPALSFPDLRRQDQMSITIPS